MSEEQVKAYLKHYAKEHDLKGKEFEHAKDRCAAGRWSALEDNAKHAKHAKPKAKKGPHKKAA